MIRNLLSDHIKNNAPDDELAVLLSGGVDSLSCAIAATDAGKTVNAYSFHLDGNESYDFHKAKEVCEIMDWNFTGVSVPLDNLEEDWFHLMNEIGCKKKTHYECVWPFLYVYPKIKEKYVLTGWGADGYHGVSKKAVMHYKHPKEKFDEFRDEYFLPEKTAGLNWHLTLSQRYDTIMVNPFLDEKVKKYFYEFTWDELNKPKQKQHIRDDFPELNSFGNIKPHLNLQLASGVDDVFLTLLDNKKINFKKRERIMDICRDWNIRNNIVSLEEFYV